MMYFPREGPWRGWRQDVPVEEPESFKYIAGSGRDQEKCSLK